MIAFVLSASPNSGYVTAGTRFCDSDGKDVFACDTFRYPACFLLLGAEFTDVWPNQSIVQRHEKSGITVADVFFDSTGEFAHGYTYSGHPVACAVALKNIEIIEREGLIEQVRDKTGPYLQARLAELMDHTLVGEVRGSGLLGAVELVPDKSKRMMFEPRNIVGNICRDFCFKNNVICRSVYDSIVMSPPLTITEAEIDELFKRLRKSLDQTLETIIEATSGNN